MREQTDDEVEWSVIGSGPAGSDVSDEDDDDDRVATGEGLRNRSRNTGCGSRSLADPAPLVPSGSSDNNDGRDEDRGLPRGSITSPVPQFPSGSSDDDARWRTVREAEGQEAEDSEIQPAVGEGQVGTLVQLADDGMFYGPNEVAEQLFGTDRDVQDDLDAEFQNASQARQTEPQNPVIFPGWPLRVPPRFAWDPEPEWGGPEGNFHQRMPARLQQDLWFVDHRRGLIVRFHVKPRLKLYLPGYSGWPHGIPQSQLTGRRRTLAMLQAPEGRQILEDDWSSTTKPTRQLDRRWTGRTEFELRHP